MTTPHTGCTFRTMDVDELEWAVIGIDDGWRAVGPDGATGPARSTMAEAVSTDLPPDLVRPDRGLMVEAAGIDVLEVVRALQCPVGPDGFELADVAEGWSGAAFTEWVDGPPVSHPDDTVVQLSTVMTGLGPCLAVWPADGSAPGVFVVFDEDRGGVAPDDDHLSSGWWSDGQMMVSAGSVEMGAHGPHVWTVLDWSDQDPTTTWLEYVPDGSAGEVSQVVAALNGSRHVYLRTTVGFPARADEVSDAGEPLHGTSLHVNGSAEFRREVFDLVCADPRAARVVAGLRDPASGDGQRIYDALDLFLGGEPGLGAVDAVLAELLGEQPQV